MVASLKHPAATFGRESADAVKDIDTLEAQFRAELIKALRRAAAGRSPTLFSLEERRARSSAFKLRRKAERIMELRQSYSVDRSVISPAASYLAACLKWEHGRREQGSTVEGVAKALLRESNELLAGLP